MKKRYLLLTLTCFVAASLMSQAQSLSLRDQILSQAKKVYGDTAPTKVTFVTVPASETIPGSLGPGRSGAGKGGVSVNGVSTKARYNAVGDTALGVTIQEGGDQAYVDASPCSLRVMVFTKPYTKVPSGSAICEGKRIARFKFVQK